MYSEVGVCGRYVRRSDKQRIAEAFNLGNVDSLMLEMAPSYNVAPTARQPVIVVDQDTGERKLQIMRWGLVPAWANSPKDFKATTFNARAEVIDSKPMWRAPFHSRRCLVPADAFYEWLKIGAKTKQPYAYSMRDDALFAFAGIWERWIEPESDVELFSYSIVTTDANELASRVHTRMPVIIKQKDYDRWLMRDDMRHPPIDLLRPYESDLMKAWKVGPNVGNVRNDEPGLCAEWE